MFHSGPLSCLLHPGSRPIQELEEDPELRQRINIYKDKDALAALQQQKQQAAASGLPAGLADDDGMSDGDEDELPQVWGSFPCALADLSESVLMLFPLTT